jgi:hypothetical protein
MAGRAAAGGGGDGDPGRLSSNFFSSKAALGGGGGVPGLAAVAAGSGDPDLFSSNLLSSRAALPGFAGTPGAPWLELAGAVTIGLEFALGLTPGGAVPDGGGVDGVSLAVLGVASPVGAVPVAGPPLLLGSCVPPMPGSVF